MRGKKVLLAGPMKRIYFHYRIRIQRNRGLLFIIEHLHLKPCASQLPSGMGAEVMESLLFLCRTRIEVGSAGVVADTEMNILWLDLPISPVQIGNTYNHPTFLSHISKMIFNSCVVIEGEVF